MTRTLDFVVLGAQKCGTSSLTVYLDEHPELHVPQHTARFFDNDRYLRGPQWLASQLLKDAPEGAKTGTVTPYYMIGSDEKLAMMAERMAETNPALRLLAIVRDPIARAYSNYRMAHRRGDVKGSFEEAAGPDKAIVTSGLYARALRPYLDHFDREQLQVSFTEQLEADPGTTLEAMFAHIGVDPAFRPPSMHQVIHRGGERTRLTQEEFQPLFDFLEEHWFANLRGGDRLHAKHGWGFFFERWNLIPAEVEPEIAPDKLAELQERFLADALELEAIAGTLPPWVQREADGSVRWTGLGAA